MAGIVGNHRRIDNQHHDDERLIPSLPDEIAVECLVRIPHEHHSTMKLVCHRWQSLFSDASFLSDRRRVGTAEHLIFLVQPLPSSTTIDLTTAESVETVEQAAPAATGKSEVAVRSVVHGPPQYSLGVYNLTRNKWNRLTMKSDGNGTTTTTTTPPSLIQIPMFCQAVSVQLGKVVLIGGWDPDTLEPVSDVYVIDLVAGNWRRGAAMRTARSFFACAVVGGRVWVAGGHDGQKNALRSAEVYDVGMDEWTAVKEMSEERDECYGIEQGGRFWVVSGYGTESQGRFRTDGEWYDEVAGEWVRVEGVWPHVGVGPRGTVVGSDEGGRRRWWCLGSGSEEDVKEFDWVEMRWRRVSVDGKRKVRVNGAGGGLSLCAVDLGEKWFVMGGGGGGGDEEQEGVYVVEKEGSVWRPVKDVPPGFLGFPFSAAHLLI